jgi:fumarate reductase subunit C
VKAPHTAHDAGADERRPYLRPMAGWWRRDPFFVHYMAREATALAVLLYAIELLVGVWQLGRGEAAWNAWLQAMKSPWSIALHLVLLAAMIFHAYTWFEVMPKTMPTIHLRGRRVPDRAITWGGIAAAVLASVVLFAVVKWGPA